ncbi:MAG: hypothetical protein KGQ93_11100 [Cyanobacteria bacterium REEB459]|nr:hypothetical protein [Cyanobacteria bacterium REEB459]
MEAIPVFIFAVMLLRWTQTTLVPPKPSLPAEARPEQELLVALAKLLEKK